MKRRLLTTGLLYLVSCALTFANSNCEEGTPCDDGNACTINDTCINGVCAGTPLVCDDGNSCTTDSCDPATGCVYTNNSSPCDDLNPCTINDVCINGICKGTPVICDDGDPCTDDDCVPGVGCVFINNSSACDDGDPCTENDQCVNGVCQGTPIDCDDGNPCSVDECLPDGSCSHTFSDGCPCDDGSLCTINDVYLNGVCAGTPIICDDGNSCTTDSCDPATGCVYTNNSSPCDDLNPCTINDVCINGICKGTPVICDDGDPCTDDDCVPGVGCVFTPISSCYTVDNESDTGPGSLRDFITNSTSGDTIVFGPLVTSIQLSSPIPITSSIAIIAPGSQTVEISGQSSVVAFGISAQSTVTLEGFTIKDCYSLTNGGAFYNQGLVVLKSMKFQNNFEGSEAKSWTSPGDIIIDDQTVEIR